MKRENEVFLAFFLGIFVGGFGLWLLISSSDSYQSRYIKAITECEKSLPRDQHCVVVGVPEVKK